jgi:hypothetical protein
MIAEGLLRTGGSADHPARTINVGSAAGTKPGGQAPQGGVPFQPVNGGAKVGHSAA